MDISILIISSTILFTCVFCQINLTAYTNYLSYDNSYGAMKGNAILNSDGSQILIPTCNDAIAKVVRINVADPSNNTITNLKEPKWIGVIYNRLSCINFEIYRSLIKVFT